jgi:hypothetical protein
VPLGHNLSITTLLRDLDARRFAAAEHLGTMQYLITERSRQYVEANAQHTDIGGRFPRDTPLDWFDPTYFNQLPVSIHGQYRNAGIALPLPACWDEDWQQLDFPDFMAEYGNEVEDLYDLPMDSDMERRDEEEVDGMMAEE